MKIAAPYKVPMLSQDASSTNQTFSSKHILFTEYIHEDIHVQQRGLGMAMVRCGPLQHSIDDKTFTYALTLLYLI